MSDDRHLLLLGCRGFIGAHLRVVAEAAGLRVTGTTRDGMGAQLFCDLRDPDSVRAAIRTSTPDLIINAAGSGSVRAGWADPAEALRIHAAAVESLLEAVAGEAPDAHVLCLSSAEVYGEPGAEDLPLTEQQPMMPVSPYGSAKAAMEVACQTAAGSLGLRVGVARLFNQIGPGQAASSLFSGIARLVALAEAEGAGSVSVPIGNPDAARDFVDVRDGARACLSISEDGLTGPFNVCSGRALVVREVVDAFDEVASITVAMEIDPDLARPRDPSSVVGSAQRLTEATGWHPAISLEQTITDLLEAWRG